MKNIDIEEQLQNSANKIDSSDFNDRWEVLQTQIADENIRRRINKKYLLPILTATFMTIALCVVLPVALNKTDDTPRFLNVGDLTTFETSEDTFYETLNKSNIKTIDFSNFNVDEYYLFETRNGDIKGGQVVISCDSGYFADISFYDYTVILDSNIETNYTTVSIQGNEVKYNTFLNESMYITNANTSVQNLNYIIEFCSVSDDFLTFINEMLV